VTVVSERERRIGANEAIFREVNERIREIDRTFSGGTGSMTIMCECGDVRCTEMIALPVADYERVRRESVLFVVVPGHEAPDVEEVVERGEGFDVVRKHPGEPAAVAEVTDPRS
jgi:hypothetical protein